MDKVLLKIKSGNLTAVRYKTFARKAKQLWDILDPALACSQIDQIIKECHEG